MAETEGGNLVASPHGITFALGMIYAGAAGDTATEMKSVLHADLPLAEWQEGINAYDLSLHARTSGSPTEWRSANKVWTEPGLPLRPNYLDVLIGVYGSPLAEADFSTAPEAERDIINEWVARQTRDRIDELFPPGRSTPPHDWCSSTPSPSTHRGSFRSTPNGRRAASSRDRTAPPSACP
ncbi:MAG: hypothetical protein OES24_01760 [Acidimicrobiia bacterium]|nr:hypothetical protein [Acidimicrobiia bacterium]